MESAEVRVKLVIQFVVISDPDRKEMRTATSLLLVVGTADFSNYHLTPHSIFRE
jgi:hypothetical protein